MAENPVAVVYLARFAEGEAPVRRFIGSYKRHAAGMQHDLMIIWKGFPNKDFSGSPQKAICNEVEHLSLSISDDGFDLTAYRTASLQLPHKFVCFLNTFSDVSAENWLSKLYQHASMADVGVAGSTASYESMGLSMKGMCKVVWLCIQGIPYDPLYADLWGHEIVKHAPHWMTSARGKWWRRALYTKTGLRLRHSARLHARFEEAWKGPGEQYAKFPGFPNPHIRSNAFLINRNLFLEIAPPNLDTKESTFEFESGRTSMTNKILALGLKTLVVGNDGIGYDLPDWPQSHTFRRGNQHNKLIADNHTKNFDEMNDTQKNLFERWTWGPPFEGLLVDTMPARGTTTSRLGKFASLARRVLPDRLVY